MRDIMATAVAAERRGAVPNAAVFGGFPQSDIPHLAGSAVVVCDGATGQGQALVDRLLDMAWERRAAFLYQGLPLATQIAHARQLTAGPVILVDHGDSTASGGTQDVMRVVEEVLRQGLEDVVAGPICAPEAAARLVAAGTAAAGRAAVHSSNTVTTRTHLAIWPHPSRRSERHGTAGPGRGGRASPLGAPAPPRGRTARRGPGTV
jgi:microcystin degradation protein MlrC